MRSKEMCRSNINNDDRLGFSCRVIFSLLNKEKKLTSDQQGSQVKMKKTFLLHCSRYVSLTCKMRQEAKKFDFQIVHFFTPFFLMSPSSSLQCENDDDDEDDDDDGPLPTLTTLYSSKLGGLIC
jgi:hypothetical protein